MKILNNFLQLSSTVSGAGRSLQQRRQAEIFLHVKKSSVENGCGFSPIAKIAFSCLLEFIVFQSASLTEYNKLYLYALSMYSITKEFR
jgi:hypothetical protein